MGSNLCGDSHSSIVLAAGPRRPEAHVVARLDNDAPIFAFLFGGVRNEPELDPEPLNLEWSDLNPAVLDLAERRQQFISARDACRFVHLRARPQVIDCGRQQSSALVKQVEGKELPTCIGSNGLCGTKGVVRKNWRPSSVAPTCSAV